MNNFYDAKSNVEEDFIVKYLNMSLKIRGELTWTNHWSEICYFDSLFSWQVEPIFKELVNQ